jgi:hypothetical protein
VQVLARPALDPECVRLVVDLEAAAGGGGGDELPSEINLGEVEEVYLEPKRTLDIGGI